VRAAPGAIPNVLAIAGSDPSGGAGIQADLKTFAAMGCYGMAAITALTAQNTREVRAVHLPPASFVAEQIATVFADIEVSAVKIGMLGSAAIVVAVATALEAHPEIPVVLDPVLVSTSGAQLGDDAVVEAMRRALLPRATLVTPNLAEAARLAGDAHAGDAADTERVARHLRGETATAWLIKGGHRDAATADDYLLDAHDGRWFSSPRHPTRNTHGTGCTLSAAIAAALAHGQDLRQAVQTAKAFLDAALAGADRLQVGHGPGPLDHFATWR
jgi:hydroxymethylpyrimidine/phosphomethylpyrimidine kinase